MRQFGTVHALDGLTFDVPTGQLVGFLGPNGAGKTTTMRAVFGLTELDAGTVTWDGHPITAPQRRRFGYMPEERGLYPSMSLAEQVEYFGRLHGLSCARRAVGDAVVARPARPRERAPTRRSNRSRTATSSARNSQSLSSTTRSC